MALPPQGWPPQGWPPQGWPPQGGPARPASPGRDRSRIERIAAEAAAVLLPRQALLGILLDATLPSARGGHPALRPFWVDEAMQRAYDMVCLMAELERRAPLRRSDRLAAQSECCVGVELAAAFRSLEVADDTALRPCAHVLRTVVRDLAELFGPVAGHLRLRTRIERLALPACQRRALVLAAAALLTDALHRGLVGIGAAEVTVSLAPARPGWARLGVAADRWQRPTGSQESPSGIAADLAALLDGEIVHRAVEDGMIAELVFPVTVAPRPRVSSCPGIRA